MNTPTPPAVFCKFCLKYFHDQSHFDNHIDLLPNGKIWCHQHQGFYIQNMEKKDGEFTAFLKAMELAKEHFGRDENGKFKRINWSSEPYCFWPDDLTQMALIYYEDHADEYEAVSFNRTAPE